MERRVARPRVLGRGVVEHDVDAQRHPGRPQVGGQRAQVVHRPQRRLDRAVVDDRVAAVVGRRPRVQQRHQVQVGDAELAQVRQPLADAGQRPGEAVDVGHVADGLLALEPVRRDLALVVEHPQLARALRGRRRRSPPAAARHAAGEPRVVAVQRDQRVAQLGEEALEAHRERVVARHHASAAS